MKMSQLYPSALFVLSVVFVLIDSKTIGFHQQDFENNGHDELHDYYAPINYKYSYGVEDQKNGDFKSHKEERTGDVVRGEYSVLGPDGIVRTVTYYVDKHSGFQAVVTKSGEGIDHPDVGHQEILNNANYASQIHQENHVNNHELHDDHIPINLQVQAIAQPIFASNEGKNLRRQHSYSNDHRHIEYIQPNYLNFIHQQQQNVQPQYYSQQQEVSNVEPQYEHKINWY
ncbi:PREDICTED: uncharacterized protein LOC108556926 [Nicrophorus vespilloides]|uniref:Uncharacterized protein LOC108556926 n=1 Tax=Nicrophorus vespilloides TaxID=110193 RepID=A0ABM1M2E0_NICVS|nr:PREDICTED: uncharacterized protein LOC108556926 [Nicrophorus vespilloides]